MSRAGELFVTVRVSLTDAAMFRAGLKPMQLMQLHWDPRYGV